MSSRAGGVGAKRPRAPSTLDEDGFVHIAKKPARGAVCDTPEAPAGRTSSPYQLAGGGSDPDAVEPILPSVTPAGPEQEDVPVPSEDAEGVGEPSAAREAEAEPNASNPKGSAADGFGETTFTERVDKEVLDMLLNGSVAGVTAADRDVLKAYSRGCRYSNSCYTKSVKYQLGKNGVIDKLGRWNARGYALQNIRRELRNVLARSNYVDVDMVNAQPRLLLQMCEKKGWPCSALREYVMNRDAVLAGITSTTGCSRADAKAAVTAIIFGRKVAPPSLKALADEMTVVLLKIQEEHADFAAKRQKQMIQQDGRCVNLSGSVAAWVLQTLERQCLEAMARSLARQSYAMDCPIHDGGLVRKHGDETELPREVLRFVEVDVAAATGYNIELLCKPMETDIVLPPRPTEEYAVKKQEFERWHCKVGGMYLMLGDGDGKGSQSEWTFLDERTMTITYRHVRLSDGSSFINKWLSDRSIRRYTGSVFWAPGYRHERDDEAREVFNMWPGLAAEKLPPSGDDESESDSDAEAQAGVQLTLDHFKSVICSGVEGAYRYLLGFIACMLRTPGNKHGSPAVILAGQKGSGKDLAVEIIQKLIGWGLTCTTKTWEDVVGDRNMLSANKLLVWVQEGGLVSKKEWEDYAKNRITAAKVRFADKYQKAVVLDDCARFINTTNNTDSIPVGERDRHYFILHVSDKRVGDNAYFDALVRARENPLVQRKLFEYFTETEALLDGWHGSQYPRTKLHSELALSTVDSVVYFGLQWLQKRTTPSVHIPARSMYSEYKTYCSEDRPGEKVLSIQAFANKIKSAAWLNKALRTHEFDHNTQVMYIIDAAAWRAEFAKNGLLTDDHNDEAGSPPLAPALGAALEVEVEGRQAPLARLTSLRRPQRSTEQQRLCMRLDLQRARRTQMPMPARNVARWRQQVPTQSPLQSVEQGAGSLRRFQSSFTRKMTQPT